MIIDFHTHTFPDAIADKAVASLKGNSKTVNFLSSKTSDLIEDNKESGISLSVILPVVTNPLKTQKINDAAAELNEKLSPLGVFSFGGIHPDTPDYKTEIKRIASLGLKGVKFHPAYQRVALNDIRFLRIIEAIEENGLIAYAHGGIDIGIDGSWSSPKMAKQVLKEVAPTKFIMAHMGGWDQWNEVEDELVGENIYFDTAFSYGDIPYQDGVPDEIKKRHLTTEQMTRIIKAHGADKVLFGTDSPWMDRKEQIALVSALPLTEEEKQLIFFKNAKKLLNI